jgi:hypothetical protein
LGGRPAPTSSAHGEGPGPTAWHGKGVTRSGGFCRHASRPGTPALTHRPPRRQPPGRQLAMPRGDAGRWEQVPRRSGARGIGDRRAHQATRPGPGRPGRDAADAGATHDGNRLEMPCAPVTEGLASRRVFSCTNTRPMVS